MMIAACGTTGSQSREQSTGGGEDGGQMAAAGEAAPVKIKLAYPSTPDFTDVPSLLVWNNPPEGLQVSYEFMAKSDIAIQGVVKGDYDIGAAPAITVLAAIDSGLPLKIVAEQMKNEFALLTPSSIETPEQLQGKRLAIHGPNTLTDALVKSTIQKYRLDQATVLTIPGSDVRAQALINGEIDATPAEISDVINVRSTAGDQFHTLIAYSQDFPLVNGTVFFATDEYIRENRDKLKVFVKALLEGYREVYEDPDYLKQNAAQHLKNLDQSVIDELADAYIQNKVLDVNGGISQESAEFTLNFNREMGLIAGDSLTMEKVYDVSIVEEVLAEIGKQ
jgi:NitT/TauT family transport system substrate-binding protein